MTINHAQYLTQSQDARRPDNLTDGTPARKVHENSYLKHRAIKRVVMATSAVAMLLAVMVTSFALHETKGTSSVLKEQSTASNVAVSPASLQAQNAAYKQNKVKGSIFSEPATH